uniref:ORC3b protein n=1 Tax=Paspalum simplex TaxID=151521 RepID=A0A0X8XHG1_9POAL|nr:ORC3b protein [Paspalum simplex]CQR79609.1 ORC3b protein [Paspalum simplex]
MSAPPCETPLTAANNIHPFVILHKAAVSSVPSSQSRRLVQTSHSQPSSPNPKPAKRRGDPAGEECVDDGDQELYEQLRVEAFHRTWSKIQATIDKVLRDMNLKLFDQVLQWVKESFSSVRAITRPHHAEVQQPYPLLTNAICRRIPTAFVLTKNAEFVDDITTFRDLAGHLESSGCHIAKLSAAELSQKHGVGGCFRSLLRRLLPDIPDVADVSALASWYCEAENFDQPIIVIIDDLEQCSGDVLGELVMMLSEWVIKIPILFVMGISTTLDAPKKLLSSEALQRLEPCKLTLGYPSDRLNALVEAILVKPCAGFCISHEVVMFLRNYFFRHDGTITSFISALKLACIKHFSMEPLSFLCIGMLEADCEEFWRDKFEAALPQAMQKSASGLPSCTNTSAQNPNNSSKNMVEGFSRLLKLQKEWSSVLLGLYGVGRYDKVQLLDIFCEAINPYLQTENASNSCMFVSKITRENLLGVKSGSGKGFIAQVMDTIRYLPIETLLHVLEVWSIHLKGMGEINDKVKELLSTTTGADSVRATKEKWTRRSTTGTGNGTALLNEKAAALLQDVTRKNLVPLESLPFHGIICFKNVSVLESALIGNPRRMIQLDLLKPQIHLKCSCCRSGTAVSGSMHDTSILCSLAQEYGDVINLHDRYIPFEGIVKSANSKGKRKVYSSPSEKKSKPTPPVEGKAMVQARFCRAAIEMQITGLVRMPSKGRPDLVQRITFGP